MDTQQAKVRAVRLGCAKVGGVAVGGKEELPAGHPLWANLAALREQLARLQAAIRQAAIRQPSERRAHLGPASQAKALVVRTEKGTYVDPRGP